MPQRTEEFDMAATFKVSVVVPVYNPGPYIEDCISSLLRQSLPRDEFEAIFVDDGSTDETPARLDRLAAEHANVQVFHEKNSGWSGTPRNIGIEASRGEYVMFVDNDDWLGDEALERMHRYAVENSSDVVIGKMAGKGRPVPVELFRRNWPEASLERTPLMDSLTPHKMFRRAFLDRHKLRFPEGRRRLEDHVFVTEAYCLAENISVLSDYVCYYHIKRDDASNAGFRPFEPAGYFGNLQEALDVVERHIEPGPLRDRMFRRWLRNEMVERLRAERLLRLGEDFRRELFTEIQAVAVARFGPGVSAGLPANQQIVAALIKGAGLAEVVAFAEWEAGIRPVARSRELAWQDGRLRLSFEAEYQSAGEPLTFRTVAGRELVDPPLGERSRAAVEQAGTDLDARTDRSSADLIIRHRQSAAQFFQPLELRRERVPATASALSAQAAGGEAVRVLLHGDAVVDPQQAAGGDPLWAGTWDVFVRVKVSGWVRETRLCSLPGAAGGGLEPVAAGEPPLSVRPTWSKPGAPLVLQVRERAAAEPAPASGRRLLTPLRAVFPFARRGLRHSRNRAHREV
jgi:glycosyltransferase involved in cell wall biosynthesis